MKEQLARLIEVLVEYLIRYVDFCIGMFKYDIEVFSESWMYWWLCIPAIAYFGFFVFKWAVIATPLVLPFMTTKKLVNEVFKSSKENKED